jgi:hypothetical protein
VKIREIGGGVHEIKLFIPCAVALYVQQYSDLFSKFFQPKTKDDHKQALKIACDILEPVFIKSNPKFNREWITRKTSITEILKIASLVIRLVTDEFSRLPKGEGSKGGYTGFAPVLARLSADLNIMPETALYEMTLSQVYMYLDEAIYLRTGKRRGFEIEETEEDILNQYERKEDGTWTVKKEEGDNGKN